MPAVYPCGTRIFPHGQRHVLQLVEARVQLVEADVPSSSVDRQAALLVEAMKRGMSRTGTHDPI